MTKENKMPFWGKVFLANFVIFFILFGGFSIGYLLLDPFYVGSPDDDTLRLTTLGHAIQTIIFIVTLSVLGIVIHWLEELSRLRSELRQKL